MGVGMFLADDTKDLHMQQSIHSKEMYSQIPFNVVALLNVSPPRILCSLLSGRDLPSFPGKLILSKTTLGQPRRQVR